MSAEVSGQAVGSLEGDAESAGGQAGLEVQEQPRAECGGSVHLSGFPVALLPSCGSARTETFLVP